ncbi:DUF3761 domain-containing protein [Arthrobacter cryoconiti]|uniref:DUF3761 domain-containing protein n=1 Tax=Arthrobacter cryoconiti TaxID=748907 RepID=A0ABV8R204_9MICC|nr:DUF3761 domain-containing protein [Arthrobacter cryoconiti]MCC9068051.1 DUF3761 domain-containing protein [Arthrobacter cryoconiti]
MSYYNSSAPTKRRWRPTISFWISASISVALMLLFALVGYFGVGLLFFAIWLGLAALYSFVFNRRSWIGLPHRKAAAIAVGGGFALFILSIVILLSMGPVESNTKLADSISKQSAISTASTPVVTSTPPTAKKIVALSSCSTAAISSTDVGTVFVCTLDKGGHLVWMDETTSKKVVAEAKTAADKLISDKAIADQVAAQVAADQVAAQVAADQVAAQVAADQVTADQAAAKKAAAPAPAPGGGATALCNDGTLSFSATHKGSCSKHHGVAVWYK